MTVMPLAPPGLDYPLGHHSPPPAETMALRPGLRWVRMPVPGPLRSVNCWLLDDGDGVALVDTGFNTDETRGAWKTLFRGEFAGVPVTRMIGTHFHPDHIGLAGWMCAFHQAPLLMTRAEWLTARMLMADARETVPDEMVAFWRGAGWDTAMIAKASERGWAGFRRIMTPMPLSYRRLKDGDQLTIGKTDWRIVVGSGHSPEHACLLDEAAGVLIAGDQVLPRISPNVSLGVTEPEGDPLGEWLASIDKLRGLDPDLLVLPGHGEPFTGLHHRLDQMADEHHGRLDALHDFLAAPARAIDCFAVLFRRPVGDDMRGMATGEALAHLRRLELDGRAVRETVDGAWWWRAI